MENNKNEYVYIIEVDEYEKLKIYTDSYPLLDLRKKIKWILM